MRTQAPHFVTMQRAQFFGQLDGCSNLARLDFFFAISAGDIEKAKCDLIEARLKCWEDSEAQYNCLTDDEEENIRRNIILKEIREALNNTEFLGESYIGSCPALSNFKRNYVSESFGNSPCSFQEILDSLSEKTACEKRKKDKFNFLKGIAQGVAAWTRLFCIDYEEIGRAHVELQSHHDLVCRLLLEKKKKKKQNI